jgi:hypothetical protein
MVRLFSRICRFRLARSAGGVLNPPIDFDILRSLITISIRQKRHKVKEGDFKYGK